MKRLSVVFLVDRRGRVLLQERDEHAPVAPNQWGMVGGHIEDGEDDEAAAYRELAEETGLAWNDGLTLWRRESYTTPGSPGPHHYSFWVGATDLDDSDIVVGEGRQIVFVEPDKAARLDLGGSAAHYVPEFLASPTYRTLASAPR